MEHVGKNPGYIHATLHSPSSAGLSVNTDTIEIQDYDVEFHDYILDWTKDDITMSIDGEPFYTYEPTEMNDSTWPFHDPFYIIFNIAMGGNWGSEAALETEGLKNGIDPNLNSVQMVVDYVRVYR
jgi:beta-glucanase (GH16 family)